jgi:hypothetical protein
MSFASVRHYCCVLGRSLVEHGALILGCVARSCETYPGSGRWRPIGVDDNSGYQPAEVNGSHAVYVSQPKAVAAIIAKAAHGVAVATR